MTGYFEVKKNSSDEFSFNLKSGNHKVILSSQIYITRQGALGGVASVQQNASNDTRFNRLTAKSNEPYFVLKATNGEVIGKSEMYSNTSSMEDGIVSVKQNGVSTTLREI